jgi:hypothetical protein
MTRLRVVFLLSQVGYSMGLPRQRGELSSNVIVWQGYSRGAFAQDAIYYEELS